MECPTCKVHIVVWVAITTGYNAMSYLQGSYCSLGSHHYTGYNAMSYLQGSYCSMHITVKRVVLLGQFSVIDDK